MGLCRETKLYSIPLCSVNCGEMKVVGWRGNRRANGGRWWWFGEGTEEPMEGLRAPGPATGLLPLWPCNRENDSKSE